MADDARESGKLMGVEKGVDGLKVNGVAGPETVRKSGKREAVFEEDVFNVGVIE